MGSRLAPHFVLERLLLFDVLRRLRRRLGDDARAAAEGDVGPGPLEEHDKAVAEADKGRPLTEGDAPAPEDPYGRSKLAAEQALARYARETGMELVIVRPPLVYGPGVGANFLRLMQGIGKGVPMRLGGVGGRRSLV